MKIEDEEVKVSEDPATPKSVKTTRSNFKNLVVESKVTKEEQNDMNEAQIDNNESPESPTPRAQSDKREKEEKSVSNKDLIIEKQEYLEQAKKPEPIQLKMNDEELKESVTQIQKMNIKVSAKKKEFETPPNTEPKNELKNAKVNPSAAKTKSNIVQKEIPKAVTKEKPVDNKALAQTQTPVIKDEMKEISLGLRPLGNS